LVDSVKVFYRLEEGAARAEGAHSRRNNHDAFRPGPIKDIISNVAIAIDCVDSTVVLVCCQELTAIGPESSRYHCWSFKFGASARERSAIHDISIAVDLPDDAVLSRHDQVVAKCPLMVERKPGVIRCIA